MTLLFKSSCIIRCNFITSFAFAIIQVLYHVLFVKFLLFYIAVWSMSSCWKGKKSLIQFTWQCYVWYECWWNHCHHCVLVNNHWYWCLVFLCLHTSSLKIWTLPYWCKYLSSHRFSIFHNNMLHYFGKEGGYTLQAVFILAFWTLIFIGKP